jgi:hypothetical protein
MGQTWLGLVHLSFLAENSWVPGESLFLPEGMELRSLAVLVDTLLAEGIRCLETADHTLQVLADRELMFP